MGISVLPRVAAESLSDRVASNIRQAIYAGRLKPGERIVETRVAKEMGVAQATVREALQQLEYLGLIVKFPNRGSFVVDLSEEQSRQIYQVRSELEALAVQLALPHCTQANCQQLSQLLAQMETSIVGRDFERFVDADLEFHRCIWRLSQNPYLEKTLLGLASPQFAYYRIRAVRGFAEWNIEAIIGKHAEILERLKGQTAKEPRQIINELREVVLDGMKNKNE